MARIAPIALGVLTAFERKLSLGLVAARGNFVLPF